MVVQHFVEVSSLLDLARYVCALRENPLRVYEFTYKKNRIFSSRKILANSILHYYVQADQDGRYISYHTKGRKESVSIVNRASTINKYAPIVTLDSLPFPIRGSKKIKDKFRPIKLHDLDDLARLTYDPEMPDSYEATLVLLPHRKKWIAGYITEIILDKTFYCFNYVEMDDRPAHPFLRYSHQKESAAEFTGTLAHGYSYMPVVQLKSAHPIFGL